jgi:hypothetical protein
MFELVLELEPTAGGAVTGTLQAAASTVPAPLAARIAGTFTELLIRAAEQPTTGLSDLAR